MLPLFENARQLKLTETEKEILDWFEANETAALHMNLRDLCAVLYTSNATIVRFCQKLGLSGYNDLKYQLRSSPIIPCSTIAVCTNDPKEGFQHIDINPRIGFLIVIQCLIELIAPSTQKTGP